MKILKTKLGPITLNSLAKKLFLKTPRRKKNFKFFYRKSNASWLPPLKEEEDGKIFKKDPDREIGGVGSALRRAQGPQDQVNPAR